MFTEKLLEQLEEKIGYCFQNKLLLKGAITHSSYTNEQKINKWGDYERLEFLGDAVLELVASVFLFEKYPELKEGILTKKRSTLVCGSSLAFCAKDIDIGEYILLGRGEESTGGRGRDSITADVMESIIGAIYLDGGYDCASAFIHRFILSDLEDKELLYDSKTLLQEHIQRTDKTIALHYAVVDESGPDHDKRFVVEARLNGQTWGSGEGKTKKAAEQQAAYEALLAIKVRE